MNDKACIFNIQKFSLHDGPGIRTVVFFKGCPLRCEWCSNPESQNAYPEEMKDEQNKTGFKTVGEYMTIDEIMEQVMEDLPFYQESGGGVTLSGGEVLYQAEFATELLRRLKEKNIHTASETTGFASHKVFAEFLAQVDYLFYDMKHYDEVKHKAGTGFSNKLILENLNYALAHANKLLVRIPVIPNYNDSLEDAEGFGRLFEKMGVKEVELLPFHQFGAKKYEFLGRDYRLKDKPQLHTHDLDNYASVIAKYGPVVQCQ